MPVHLSSYEPEDRIQRRRWLQKLAVSTDIAMLTRSYGGNTGNVSVVWRVDSSSENHETDNARVTLAVTEKMSVYHTRQMRKDFVEKVVLSFLFMYSFLVNFANSLPINIEQSLR